MHLSFDELAELYDKDPQGYETLRQELVNEIIQSSTPRSRIKLQQLQWRIEGIIRRKEGLGAAIKLSSLMIDKFLCLDRILQSIRKKEQKFSPNQQNI